MSVPQLALNASGDAGDIAGDWSSTSFFSRLSMDPLQIVMQQCDTHSLLALARCDRTALEAASFSFAWSHAPYVVAHMALCDHGDPPLRRLWNRFRRVIGRPNDLPELPPLPQVDANSTRPPASHAVGQVRWTCKANDIGDWARLRTALRVLPTLPWLVAIDFGDWHFRHAVVTHGAARAVAARTHRTRQRQMHPRS